MKQVLFLICLFIVFPLTGQDDPYLIHAIKNHKKEVKAVGFSKSGKILATGGEDKSLFLVDVKTGENLYEYKDMYYTIADLEFYGDEQIFITAGNDIKLIDKENNTMALFKGNATDFWSIDFAPERNKITGGSYDKKIKVWDVKTQQMELVLEGHEKSTLPVAFSPDEKCIVSGSLDLSIKIWNAKDGSLLHSYEKHSKNIYDVAFHPNPRYFASASGDKTIRLWDIQEGKVIKTYSGHDGDVLDVEFSPDGYFLYSAAVDGMVMIWEVSTGAKLYSYNAHEGPVYTVAVSNDGNLVATGGSDSRVYIWNSAKLIAIEYYFDNEFNDEKNSNPIFEPKRKGETKETYEQRQKEAELEMNDLLEKYFGKYQKKMNYKNIPQ